MTNFIFAYEVHPVFVSAYTDAVSCSWSGHASLDDIPTSSVTSPR